MSDYKKTGARMECGLERLEKSLEKSPTVDVYKAEKMLRDITTVTAYFRDGQISHTDYCDKVLDIVIGSVGGEELKITTNPDTKMEYYREKSNDHVVITVTRERLLKYVFYSEAIEALLEHLIALTINALDQPCDDVERQFHALQAMLGVESGINNVEGMFPPEGYSYWKQGFVEIAEAVEEESQDLVEKNRVLSRLRRKEWVGNM